LIEHLNLAEDEKSTLSGHGRQTIPRQKIIISVH